MRRGVVSLFAVLLCVMVVAVGCAPHRGNPACVDPLSAYAAGALLADNSDTKYSSAVSDLEKDENFDVSKYPIVPGDASLDLIQIAESTDGEVLAYVYQPGGEEVGVTATEIRLSTGINENLKYNDYKLTLLTFDETLYKYRVEGLTVSGSRIRYYDVAQIARPWDKRYDKSILGMLVGTKVYKVGKRWEACTVGGSVSYNVVEVEVVVITDKLVGWIRYPNGLGFIETSACDGHFVGFSTDHDIDRLLEARVEFNVKTYKKSLNGNMTYGEEEPKEVTLSYDEEGANPAGGLFGKKYTWKRIQSAEEFAKNDALSGEGKKRVREMQWVLNFYETEFSVPVGGADILLGGLISLGIAATKGSTGSIVSEVSILQLTFETDGQVYNMGAVDNKMTGSNMTAGASDKYAGWEKLWNWLKRYWYIPVICLGAFVVLCVVLRLTKWSQGKL